MAFPLRAGPSFLRAQNALRMTKALKCGCFGLHSRNLPPRKWIFFNIVFFHIMK
jgi:hypothetical protein